MNNNNNQQQEKIQINFSIEGNAQGIAELINSVIRRPLVEANQQSIQQLVETATQVVEHQLIDEPKKEDHIKALEETQDLIVDQLLHNENTLNVEQINNKIEYETEHVDVDNVSFNEEQPKRKRITEAWTHCEKCGEELEPPYVRFCKNCAPTATKTPEEKRRYGTEMYTRQALNKLASKKDKALKFGSHI